MLAPEPGPATAPPGSRKANQRDTRHHNLRLVLGTLYREGELSRADIGRRTLLTKVAVSDLVAELLVEGVVEEVGRRSPTGRGKPATYLRINPAGRCVVAVDLSGADRLRCALVDLRGHVLGISTLDLQAPPTVPDVVGLVRQTVAGAAAPVLGVAVGTPGTVTAAGEVVSAPLLGWTGVPLGELLAQATDLPVVVENDANAAVMAERTFGGGAPDLVLVQLARGVGAGVLVGDSVVRGASSAAGEIGHVVVDPDGPPCPCGKRGCLEAMVSGSALRSLAAGGPRDDPAALSRVHERSGQLLGAALAPVVGLLDVPEVVLAGDADVLSETLVDALTHAVTTRTSSDFRRDVIIRRSLLGPDAVLQGVSALLLRERLAAF